METLVSVFMKAGFVKPEQNSKASGMNIQYLNNADGSVRWAWPNDLKTPLFLNFYNQESKRGKIFSGVIKAIFSLGLQRFVFKSKHIDLIPGSDAIIENDDKWALFTGTVGPNRKAILYKENIFGKSFTKIALGQFATHLLQNEQNALGKLRNFNTYSFTMPAVVHSDNGTILELTNVSENSHRISEFGEPHLEVLEEMSLYSQKKMSLSKMTEWNKTISALEELKTLQDLRLPKGMIRKLSKLITKIDPQQTIYTSFSHGDFTSWNMYESNGKLNIYDWELAHDAMPAGFDAFHFIIQQGILVDKKSWAEIQSEINVKISKEDFSRMTLHETADVSLYQKLYLIFNTVYYLKLYANQEKWHTQVYWLLNTWNAALSDMASVEESHRALVISDVFDFLSNKTYAALKFPNGLPEKLSEYSDIDLCIEKSGKKTIIEFLEKHPLVKHVKTASKSFMANSQIFFADGSMLSLDLIWEIKRKNLVMMDIKKILQMAYTNDYGVKMPALQDTIRFVGLFYALNKTKVPAKFAAYEEVLGASVDMLDKNLHGYFVDGSNANKIHKMVKSRKENFGFHAAASMLNYVMDSIRGVFAGRGMVITFSGVDGAGKSTVIENIRHNIDKKLRRKVIVIRHRPSLLPILSVWTKGKEAAEKEATDRLPRQGNNFGFLSSLARFSYYYCDYFFGQFYIYFKYVMRGYVVLYDRYYFDFINDSRRSNIQLPEFITRTGYRFLMKPDFNFFLYADAETILARKKELDSDTIKELTSKYLQLFDILGQNTSKKRYIAINNIDLSETLSNIMGSLNLNAA